MLDGALLWANARDNHILAFKVGSDLVDVDAIRVLVSFGDRITRTPDLIATMEVADNVAYDEI